jgi:signal-transduction protein with cAMP-binding, CBS, and nucleotidyltransferase domain
MVPSRAVEDIANRILLSLPQASLKRLRPALEFRSLAKGEAIDRLDQSIEYMHFVNRGLISFVKIMQDGRSVEIGVVGIEGISSPYALFGIDKAVLETMVQIPGTTFRIKRDQLIEIMAQDDALQEAFDKYARFYIAAIAQTAACNRLHYLEERCLSLAAHCS